MDNRWKKWDKLHDKPLCDFKDVIDFTKFFACDIATTHLILTFNALKPRITDYFLRGEIC